MRFLHRHQELLRTLQFITRLVCVREDKQAGNVSFSFFLSFRVKVVSVLATLQLRIIKRLSLVSDLLLFWCDTIPCIAQACALPSKARIKKTITSESSSQSRMSVIIGRSYHHRHRRRRRRRHHPLVSHHITNSPSPKIHTHTHSQHHTAHSHRHSNSGRSTIRNLSKKSAQIAMHAQSTSIARRFPPLTEPQLPHVFEPPAIAALHFGQVLCIFALLAGVGISVARWDLRDGDGVCDRFDFFASLRV